MKKIINRYLELSKKHKELCFKIKKDNYFIIAIVSNDGLITYELDNIYYNLFDVETINEYALENSINASIDLLDSTSFDNVGYFIGKNKELIRYFGNQEIINIPDNFNIIASRCFKNNSIVRSVHGLNIREIQYYAFIDNENLEMLDFPNCRRIGNLLRVPKLKYYVVDNNLKGIINEDNNYISSITFSKTNTTYYFDDNLENEFLKALEAIKSNPSEIVQVAKISESEKKFRSIMDNKDNPTIKAISHADMYYSMLSKSVRELIKDHTIYIISECSDAGFYVKDLKTIVLDRYQISIAFFHEIGHAIDYCLGKISDKIEFKKLYYMESQNIYKNTIEWKMCFMAEENYQHFISSSEEYFAESFQRYMEGSEDFRNECPNTYTYFENLINTLEKEFESNKEYTLKLK